MPIPYCTHPGCMTARVDLTSCYRCYERYHVKDAWGERDVMRLANVDCDAMLCDQHLARCIACNAAMCFEHANRCVDCHKPICEEHLDTDRCPACIETLVKTEILKLMSPAGKRGLRAGLERKQ